MGRENFYSLLLLAGGKNKRMHTNKAELIYQGRSFAWHMLAKARELGIVEAYLSGFEMAGENIHTVWDAYPDRGPLGGLHACMKEIKTPFCLVLPVDVPGLPQDVLEALLDHHERYHGGRYGMKELPLIWEHGDRKEPLIGIYPVEMASEIGNLISERSAPVFRMLDRWGYECYRKEISESTVINVNTPQLYRELIRDK